jgi:hypothetical protein
MYVSFRPPTLQAAATVPTYLTLVTIAFAVVAVFALGNILRGFLKLSRTVEQFADAGLQPAPAALIAVMEQQVAQLEQRFDTARKTWEDWQGRQTALTSATCKLYSAAMDGLYKKVLSQYPQKDSEYISLSPAARAQREVAYKADAHNDTDAALAQWASVHIPAGNTFYKCSQQEGFESARDARDARDASDGPCDAELQARVTLLDQKTGELEKDLSAQPDRHGLRWNAAWTADYYTSTLQSVQAAASQLPTAGVAEGFEDCLATMQSTLTRCRDRVTRIEDKIGVLIDPAFANLLEQKNKSNQRLADQTTALANNMAAAHDS